MNEQIVPINTGRVRIGSKYTPPRRPPVHDTDALRLQASLCPPSKRVRRADAAETRRALIDAACWSGSLLLLGALPFADKLFNIFIAN
jgi:hypothetical protein